MGPKCICLCICVIACLTPQIIAIGVLVPRAFQKYTTCMVCDDFVISGEKSGRGWMEVVVEEVDGTKKKKLLDLIIKT